MKNTAVNFVGIDISKETFDAAAIINGKRDEIQSMKFNQNKEGMKGLLKWLKELAPDSYNQTFYCMEFTGIYNIALTEFLCENQSQLCIEDAKQIKLSLGLQRGKNDKIDAKRIALYAFKNYDELKLFQAPRKELVTLRTLVVQRNLLVQTKVNLEQNLNELKDVGLKHIAKQIAKYNHGIKGIIKDIEQIEKDIQDLVKQDASMNKQVAQITSIPGIGWITAVHLIVFTNEFKTISEGKKLACHCGVAPFDYSSGKSIKGKARVSHAANKTLKKLLHLCVITSLRIEGEFKAYYERKLAEGKHKLAIINAIKNKMLLRVAALINGDKMYVKNYVYNV